MQRLASEGVHTWPGVFLHSMSAMLHQAKGCSRNATEKDTNHLQHLPKSCMKHLRLLALVVYVPGNRAETEQNPMASLN